MSLDILAPNFQRPVRGEVVLHGRLQGAPWGCDETAQPHSDGRD